MEHKKTRILIAFRKETQVTTFRPSRMAIGLLAIATSWSCNATLGSGTQGDSDPGGGPNPPGTPDEGVLPGGESHAQGWQPGKEFDPLSVSRLNPALLTRAQYQQSLKLIFANVPGVQRDEFAPADEFPAETRGESGFTAVAGVSDLHVARFLDASEEVVEVIAPQLTQTVGCEISAMNESTCLRALEEKVGEMLYRRPFTADESAANLSFFRAQIEELERSHEESALALVALWLNSPYFLYRWELGHQPQSVEGEAVRMNAYQIASRLSFFLWNSGPDAQLLGAARSGALDTPQGVAEEARRLVEDPRAELALQSFVEQWLDLGHIDELFKDPMRFPQWNSELSQAMKDEVETFTKNVILKNNGTVNDLFSSSTVFVNEALAPMYGLEGVVGPELRELPYSGGKRAGLLTMPGVLASIADASVPNPFRLGETLLAKIFCEELQPPPDLPEFTKPESAKEGSEREYLEELTSPAVCSSCHLKMNPLGFGLGDFDAIGAIRMVDDHGHPIDSSGVMPSGEVFSGPEELAAAVANNSEVRSCMTKQWFRYATGTHETETDYGSLAAAYGDFEARNFTMKELLVALVTTRSFLYRATETGESFE